MGNVDLLVTFTLAALSCVLALRLFEMPIESSWPLAYAVLIYLYYESHAMVLAPYAVYAMIVCTLLLRFEFLGRAMVVLLRTALLAGVSVNAWALFRALDRGLR